MLSKDIPLAESAIDPTADQATEPSPAQPDQRKASELARLQEIRRVGTERAGEIARTLADAFSEDPFSNWVFSHADGRLAEDFEERHFKYWRFCAEVPPMCEIHCTGDLEAVAIWYPIPGSRTPTRIRKELEAYDKKFMEYTTELATPERRDDYKKIIKAIDKFIPKGPCWYLGSLGVAASRQSQGLGAKVASKMLNRCDRQNITACLESSNPRNVSFYKRLGFVAQCEPISINGSASLLPMIRRPKAA